MPTPWAFGTVTQPPTSRKPKHKSWAYVNPPKPVAPKTSWWTEPTTREEFHRAAQQRDQVMGWSHGSQGRELRTMYEEWKFTR